MKKMKQAMAILLATVLAVPTALAGCGSTASTSSQTSAASTASTATASTSAESTANSDAAVTIDFWSHNGTAFVEFDKKMIAAYEEEHPNVTINYQNFPYEATTQKLKAAFAAGNEPDVVQSFGSWMPVYEVQGLLAEVPEDMATSLAGDYLPGAVEGYAYKGKYYGVPTEMNVEYGLFYVPEKAEAAGVTGAPQTFDDVLKIAKNSATYDNGLQTYGGLEFYNNDNLLFLFLSWIRQYGGDYWDASGTHVDFSGDAAQKAFQKLVDLIAVDKVSDLSHLTADIATEQYFFSGKAAEIVKGSWAQAVGDELKNDDWKFCFMPPVEGTAHSFVVEPGWGYIVSNNSDQKTAAWDFVRYMTTKEATTDFNLSTGTITPLKAVVSDTTYTDDESNKRIKDQFQYLTESSSIGPVMDSDYMKVTLRDIYATAVSGTVSVKDSLTDFQTKLNAHIDEILAQAN